MFEYPEIAAETPAPRTMPQNPEAEKAVVGCMQLREEALAVGLELLSPQDFYNPVYRCIFEAMRDLFNNSKHVDAITIADILEGKGVFKKDEAFEILVHIFTSISTASNIRAYIEIVKADSTARKLIKAGEEIIANAYNAAAVDTGKATSIDKILEKSETAIFDISQGHSSKDFVHVSKVLGESVSRVFELAENGGILPGISTGFRDLDEITTGFHKSDLILIAARPSMGKTALVLNIAANVAMRENIPVAVFSLEMRKEQLTDRMISSEGMIDAKLLRTGQLEPENWDRYFDAIKRISKAPIYIDDTSAISPSQIRSKCRRLKLKEKQLGLIVIDYLQLMTCTTASGKRSENRQQEISEISRNLKVLAKEMDCPVIALSQLNRAVEGRADKRPMLSDLRESGAIEQDADLVCFIYRDEYYNPESEKKGIAEIIIAKQRNGETGVVDLKYMGKYVSFRNLEHYYY